MRLLADDRSTARTPQPRGQSSARQAARRHLTLSQSYASPTVPIVLVRAETAMHVIRRSERRPISLRGDELLARADAAQPVLTQESFDRAPLSMRESAVSAVSRRWLRHAGTVSVPSRRVPRGRSCRWSGCPGTPECPRCPARGRCPTASCRRTVRAGRAALLRDR